MTNVKNNGMPERLTLDFEMPLEIVETLEWISAFSDLHFGPRTPQLPHRIVESAVQLLFDLASHLPDHLVLRWKVDEGVAAGASRRVLICELDDSADELIATIRALQALLDCEFSCGHADNSVGRTKRDQGVIGSSLRLKTERDRVATTRDGFERSEESDEGGAL